MNPFSLEGKTILVTGASSGIGRAISVVCSGQGARLVITGRNAGRLNETLSLLDGKSHTCCTADLTVDEELDALIQALPQLDGVVSCAGIVQPLLLKFAEKSDIEKMLQTNALSAIHLTRLLVQEKKLKKTASIVYISSINGNECVYPASTLYAASKSMITGFMKGVALELSPQGIRANCIHPGMIETGLLKDSPISPEELEKDRLRYPLKRYGKPEEVAYAAFYLLSDAAQWVTGTSLVIDGGYTLQ